MQTRDSLRWGLRFANALGPPVGKLAPAAAEDGAVEKPSDGGFLYASGGALSWRGSDGTTTKIEKAKPGNPWRDEFGRFTDEAHALFNVNAKLPAAELEARAASYEEQADKRRRKAELDGIEGLKKGFLHYSPKGMQTGDESPEWHTLNRAVGKAEAVANEYLDRYRAAGEGLTEEGRALINYWLANASALRDMSRILAGKRDGGDEPVHEHDAPLTPGTPEDEPLPPAGPPAGPPAEMTESPAEMAAEPDITPEVEIEPEPAPPVGAGVRADEHESPDGDEDEDGDEDDMGKSLTGFLSPFFPLSSNRGRRPTPTHRWLSKQNGLPDFIQEAFDVIDEQENGGEFTADHATRAKAYVVNNAVQVGLIDREAANDILSAIGAEEVQEEPK